MYLTLNGSDNCTAIAPRPCNGLSMLRRGLEVVGLIIIIIIKGRGDEVEGRINWSTQTCY